MVMINPKLDDIQSSNNVMSVRGRGERIEYVSKWEEIYHFRHGWKALILVPCDGPVTHLSQL